MGEPIGPDVTITLPYEDALRLSYMAQWPATRQEGDQRIADTVNRALMAVEDEAAQDV
jgi:hypothetical protein